MKITGIMSRPLETRMSPYVVIANALMRNQGKEIHVDSEGEFSLTEEALAEKIQQEWGKQPGRVVVKIADNARSPECYLVRVIE